MKSVRLILRPWEDGDAESLVEYAKDPVVGRLPDGRRIRAWKMNGHTHMTDKDDVDVPLMHEKRTEHVTLLTKKMWMWTKSARNEMQFSIC